MKTKHVSPKTIVVTTVALLALWALSFGLSYAHLGRAAMPVALAIAAAKAALVALFFMELVRERASIRLAFVAALALAACLVAFATADVLTR